MGTTDEGSSRSDIAEPLASRQRGVARRFRLGRGLLVLLLTALAATAAPAQGVGQNRKLYPLPQPTVPGCLGVNIHFTDPQPGEASRIAGGGFRWIRMDFTWSSIERQKGRYDFSAYDRLLAALKPEGIRPIFILCYGNDLYEEGSPRSPEARAAFARFVTAGVTHFRDQGILWEMWNEPNIGFWKPVPKVSEYIALALEAGRALRQAAPQEWYIGPATSGVDVSFIEECLKAGLLKYWDGVSVHPYRNTPPETAATDLRALRQLIDRYSAPGSKVPIISGEWGYSERYPGLDLEKQSQYLPREMLTNISLGVILSIWYDWRDDGPDPKEPEHHFGTLYLNNDPKPTYRAAQTLARCLNGLRFSKRLALGSPNDYCLLFSGGGKHALVAWTTTPTRHAARVPTGPGRFRVTSYTGEDARSLAAVGGNLTLQVSGSPQYITPEGAAPLVSAAARWTALPQSLPLTGKDGLLTLLPTLARPAGLPRASVALVGPSAKRVRLQAGLTQARYDAALSQVANTRDRYEGAKSMRLVLAAPGLGEVSQEAEVTSTSPLRITPLAPLGGELPVRLESLKGSRLVGRVSLVGQPGPAQPVLLTSAAPSAIVRLKAAPTSDRSYRFAVRVEEKVPGRGYVTVAQTPKLEAAPLEDFSEFAEGKPLPEGAYGVVPDGDPKVESTISATVVASPPGVEGASRALRVDYKFAPGWKFLRISPQGDRQAPLSGKPYALAMWVHGTGTGDLLRARFTDSTGQTFQPDGGAQTWQGWKYISFPLTGENAGRWGGADDGIVHLPIHLDTLLLIDSPGGRGGEATVYATGVTLLRKP